MQKKVFTVIVTYNGERWIRNTIKSLLNDNIDNHVIIVDNNSTDATRSIVKEEFSGAQLIKSSSNLGFGGANNIGIKEALAQNADYIFLLNQDAHVEKGSIKDLLGAFTQNKSLGIVSPVHLSGQKGVLDYGFKEYVFKYSQQNVTKEELWSSTKLIPCKFINAAAWLIKRDVLETVGGFNPIFHHYGEDNDYVNRLHYFKYSLAVLTGTFIYHDRRQYIDFGNIRNNINREKIAFLKLFTNINFSQWKVILKSLDKLIRETIYFVIHLKFKRAIGVMIGFIKSLAISKSAFKSRKESKKEGAYLS